MGMRRAPALPLVVIALVPAVAWPQGNPVGPEFRVNTYTPGNEFGSSVAADAAGNFVVVWQSSFQDGSMTGIYGQRYAVSGAPLGAEFQVNTYTTSNQFTSAVAADAAGDFVAVWTSVHDGANFGIFGQRYAASGAPLGLEFRVNTHTTGTQSIPDVAAATGAFVVAWMSDQGGGFDIFAQRYAGSGGPAGPEFRVNTFTTGYQAFPQVGLDPAGGFVVVWESFGQDGSSQGLFAQRYAGAGAPLGPEFRVNTYTVGDQSEAEVAMDGAGNFVVVWRDSSQDGSGYGIFAQRFAASGVPVGGEFRVNTYTTANQARPVVALDSSGNFVVAWEGDGQDGSAHGIFGQRYDAAGAPLGAEFRVNSSVTDEQVDPAVAAAPAGEFVVVWSGQDGLNYGVFGQRYAAIVPVELTGFAVE
jgi:hypothetical protein